MKIDWTEMDNKIINLINQGLSYEKIGNELGIHREQTRKRCINLGVKSKYYELKSPRNHCLTCGEEIVGKDRTTKKFCNRSCSATYNRKIRENCICGNRLTRNCKRFCSIDCQSNHNYTEYIKRWKNGEETGMRGKDGISYRIRKYLFIKYDNKCCICSWGEINQTTFKIPLQVDHIDGNYKNNKEENLRLLCPNCHSLTNNYGYLNIGKGREGRQVWRVKNNMES